MRVNEGRKLWHLWLEAADGAVRMDSVVEQSPPPVWITPCRTNVNMIFAESAAPGVPVAPARRVYDLRRWEGDQAFYLERWCEDD